MQFWFNIVMKNHSKKLKYFSPYLFSKKNRIAVLVIW